MTLLVPPITRGGFSKSRRIRSRIDFQRIQESRFRLHTRHFIFVLASRPAEGVNHPGSRLGLVVSRKVGNAVVRNRVKRLLREAFRATCGMFHDGLDLVVIARSAPEDWKLSDVTAEWLAVEGKLKQLSSRLGLKTG